MEGPFNIFQLEWCVQRVISAYTTARAEKRKRMLQRIYDAFAKFNAKMLLNKKLYDNFAFLARLNSRRRQAPKSATEIIRLGGPPLQLHPIGAIQHYDRINTQQWAKENYIYIFLNSSQIFEEYYGSMELEPSDVLKPPKWPWPQLDSVLFWHKLIMVIATKIVQVRHSRKRMLREDSQTLATTFWAILAVDLQNALKEHEKAGICQLTAYLHLYGRVKWMYRVYVKDLPPYKNALIPEYESWFEPLILDYLEDRDKTMLKKIDHTGRRNRYYSRKKDDPGYPHFLTFPVRTLLSHLTSCLNTLLSLETKDAELKNRYMKRYAESVAISVGKYTELVKTDFLTHMNEIVIIMALMTNVKLLEAQVDALIKKMGGTDLEPNTARILRDVELNIYETTICFGKMYANRPKPPIDLTKHIYENVDFGSSDERIYPPAIPARAPRGYICLFEYIFKPWLLNTKETTQ